MKIATLVEKPSSEPLPEEKRTIADLLIGETAYTVQWALEINGAFLCVKAARGDYKMGIRCTDTDEYEVWLE